MSASTRLIWNVVVPSDMVAPRQVHLLRLVRS
jgi:hypothetical protein